MDNLVDLYCVVDDFCQFIIPELNKVSFPSSNKRRATDSRLSSSEIMTIIIHFHQSHYRDFKTYYIHYVAQRLKREFPHIVSYNRFVELMPRVILLLCLFIQLQAKTFTGIYFIDSTTLSVCHHKRASNNKVFKGLAQKSKSTMGWFFGFKLHLVINDKGELLAFQITQARTDDRKPVDALTKGLMGKLIGDKGYISAELFKKLYERGLKLITRIRKNMKNKLVPMIDKLLLRKRAIVETVIDQLKNISQIEHSRHRSPINCMVNVLAGIAAYCVQPKKPSLNLNPNAIMIA
jgi:hypothetical protein